MSAARSTAPEGYGAPPRTLLGAAAYSVRVLLRRGALERGLVTARAELVAAQEGRRDALVQLVDSLPVSPAPGDPLAPWLAPLHRYRTGPADPSQQPFELQWAADVNEALAAVMPRRLAAAAHAREYADLHLRVSDERTRAEARQKRVEIERRATENAARASGRPPAIGGPGESERSIRVEELDRLRAEEASALAARDGAQGRLDAVDAEVADLERQKQRLEDRGAQRLAEMRGFREGERREAFVRAGEQILDWCPGAVSGAQRAVLAAADASIVVARARLDEVELLHGAFDPRVHRRGVVVVGVLVAAVVLAVLAVAIAGHS